MKKGGDDMEGMDEVYDMKWMEGWAKQDQGRMKEGWKHVGVWMENGK